MIYPVGVLGSPEAPDAGRWLANQIPPSVRLPALAHERMSMPVPLGNRQQRGRHG
jgi:hypothetical protein